MFTHGTITGMLFFCVGVLYEKAHTRDIDIFGGIAKRMPMLIAALLHRLLRLAGPARAERLRRGVSRLHRLLRALPVQTILGAFGVVLTAGYLLWMLRRSFYGPLNMKWSWADRRDALEASR